MSRSLFSRCAALVLYGGLAAGLTACVDGVVSSTGAFEPIQVSGGQFFPGPLPVGTAGPTVQTVNAPSTQMVQGTDRWSVSGDADLGAYAILIAMQNLSTGYWSVPVGEPDAEMSGSVIWGASVNFSPSIPLGTQNILFSAINGTGQAGPVNPLTLTFESPVPKGAVVISLTWDNAADLDLHIVAPDGAELDPQHPNTAAMREPDGGLPPGTAVLDRVANNNCVEDGIIEEDAVFATQPAPGTYLVRVDMFSACGEPAADFIVTERVEGVVKQTVKGQLLAIDADGGGPGSGLFVMQLSF